MHRRHFLGLAAAAPLAHARTLKSIGAQLYTLRAILPKDPAATLKALEAIGYREVEVISATLPTVWPALQQTKLKAVSVHIDTAKFLTATTELPAALDDAAKRGIKFAICPYIAPKDRGGVDVIKKMAANLTKAGEQCRKSGMTLAYHNHAFEFAPAPGGGTLLDVLMSESDPKLVTLELDMMWAQVAGVSPVSLLEKYGKRVTLMHLKDLAKGTPQRLDEGIPRDAFREVGAGQIDVAAVLKAAKKAGVKHYFVEQDQTPGDPLESLKKSYAYLSKLNF